MHVEHQRLMVCHEGAPSLNNAEARNFVADVLELCMIDQLLAANLWKQLDQLV